MVSIKIEFENIILPVFFGLILFLGPGAILNHEISHPFPYGYLASDAFQHQIRAEAIKDIGNFKYEAPYISLGFENAIGRYPPLLYHVAVMFSGVSGLEVYDAIYFIVLFFAASASILFYLIVRNFNRNIAIISFPVSIMIFTMPNVIGFTWGHWPSVFAQCLMIAFFWAVSKSDLDKFFVVIAISLAAVILAHTSEAVFAGVFLLIYLAVKFLTKKLSMKAFKNIIIGGFIAVILSSYYVVIFMNTWAKTQPYSFVVEQNWEGNPGFYIMDFKVLFLIFLAVGIISSFLKFKDMADSLIVAFAMLMGGFMNYAGFGFRSFQIRFLWPIYLSVLIGFGIYILTKFIIRKWNVIYSAAIASALLVLMLSGIIFGTAIAISPKYNYQESQGIMNPYHWKLLGWLSKNTEEKAQIYFFYSELYSQDALLRNSKRVHFQIDPEDFFKAIQDKEIRRSYVTEMPGDGGGSIVAREGFFSFRELTSTRPSGFSFGPHDICTFNYLVFDKPLRENDPKVYNIMVAQELMKKEFIRKVYENEVAIVLKNSKPGEDCIEKRSF